VEASVYSIDGKYAFSKSMLISSKNLYSKATIPVTMVHGDFYEIPITVTNNMDSSKWVKVEIDENF
jgi:uncharacterized protein YfaS (alpha-2-macroglobulin family)